MGCKFCVREENGLRQRHVPAGYHALAERRGFFWLGPVVKSALEQTVWECPNGHRWSARYNAIQQGTGCARCGHERGAGVRRQPAEYHCLAVTRGFKWLGPVVDYGKARTEWECESGHRWWSTYNWIHQGRGCRLWAGLSPVTPGDFYTLAARRGFLWISKECVNSSTRTEWRCRLGHEWRTTYSSFRAVVVAPNVQESSGKRYRNSVDSRKSAVSSGMVRTFQIARPRRSGNVRKAIGGSLLSTRSSRETGAGSARGKSPRPPTTTDGWLRSADLFGTS